MSGREVLAARRRRAWGIVTVLAVGLLISFAVSSFAQPGVLREAAGASVPESGIGPPEGFEGEAFRLDAREDVRVDEENGLVGFSCYGEVDEVLVSLEGELKASGWKSVSSGNEGWESFVKNEGRYRWMFVTCVDVGESVSVVVRFETTEEGA